MIEEVSDEWLKGRLNGNEGIFPRSFVEPADPPAPTKDDTAESNPVPNSDSQTSVASNLGTSSQMDDAATTTTPNDAPAPDNSAKDAVPVDSNTSVNPPELPEATSAVPEDPSAPQPAEDPAISKTLPNSDSQASVAGDPVTSTKPDVALLPDDTLEDTAPADSNDSNTPKTVLPGDSSAVPAETSTPQPVEDQKNEVPVAGAGPQHGRAVAVADFPADHDGDLALQIGDEVRFCL